jgi:lysophospholipase L1-like esterase
LFRSRADVFVLSIQPDIAAGLVRSNQESYLFYPNDASTWSAGDRAWLGSEFSYAGLLSADESAECTLKIIDRIRETSDAPILIYNVSSFIPGENIHCYQFIGPTLSSRIKHFNNNLIEISEKSGISIVDVDRLVSGYGAEALKIDGMHLNAKGYELVSREVVRILSDVGIV